VYLFKLVFGTLKDKKIPILIRVIMALYVIIVSFKLLLPLLKLTIISLLALVLVGIIVGIILFVLLFPLLCFCLSIIDIFLGKRLRDYKENKLLRYHLPGFTYYFSGILLIGVGGYLENRISLFTYHDNIYLITSYTIALYVCISILYVFIFYLGMWRRIGHIDKGKYFIKTLGKHRKFLKLSFIPVSFVVTVLGFISVFGDINISFILIMRFVFGVLDGVKQNSLLNGIILMIIVYVFSIPVQLLALFINNLFVYVFEEGHYYKQMIIRISKPVYNNLKSILWSEDYKGKNIFKEKIRDENSLDQNP